MSTRIPRAVGGATGNMVVRPEWLALHREAAIDPAIPLIDAHHHIWDTPGGRYLFDDFLGDVQSGHNFDATVFVECHSMYRARGPQEMAAVGETEFIAGVAAQSDSGLYGATRICAAIVGAADVTLGARVEPVLAAQLQAAGGRLRSIRARAASDPDHSINQHGTPPGLLADAATRQAIAAIARAGLSLDIWAFQTQVDDVLDVCRRFPELPIIINHAGSPLGMGAYRSRRGELFPVWAEGVRAMGRMPNAVMKISGLAMRYLGLDFHLNPQPPSSDALVAAWQRYFEVCVEAFGTDRCMFASNFPVDKAMCGYDVLWNAFKKLCNGYSETERYALLHDTAKRAYRIGDPG